MYVYKAAFYNDKHRDGIPCIVTLSIPANTRVRLSTNDSGKCRAERAKVLRIETLGGLEVVGVSAYSGHDTNFRYRVGRTVRPTRPFSTKDEECASGIHFFFTKALARAWARQ